MDPNDDLNQRLQKLKGEDRRKSIEQNELEQRVAKLKGIDPSKYSAPPITVYQPPDTRTDLEKSNALLAQLMSEAAIDQDVGTSKPPLRRRHTIDEELEIRLNKLKGVDPETPSSLADKAPMEIDSEEETEQLLQRVLNEAKLPEVPSESVLEVEEDVKDEVLTWCNICNEDARLKCLDCDGDLYCLECYREFHGDSDTKRHRSTSYRPPK